MPSNKTPENMKPLSLGTSTFSALRGADEVYVDKTALMYELCRRRSKILLSRPRRCGKSLLLSTFESLFRDGTRNFAGLAIEKLWTDTTYTVVQLDFSIMQDFQSAEDFERDFLTRLCAAFRKAGYDGGPDFIEFSVWLQDQPDNSIVLLVDEYDAPLVNSMENPALFSGVQRVLGTFYATLKSLEGALSFFFVTGITKLSNTGIFSGFNNLNDISLSTEYATLLGYTEEEIGRYFSLHLDHAAKVLHRRTEDVLTELRKNYNGFSFDERGEKRVFCPWSVLNFLNAPAHGFATYWYRSGGQPNVLKKYLLNHTLGDPASFSQPRAVWLEDLNASRDYDNLPLEILLFQAGYLTIQAVQDEERALLGFPNLEVARSFARLHASELLGGKVYMRPDGPSLNDLLSSGNLDEAVDRFNRVFNALDYAKYPVRDEATCRAYLQVLMMGADMVPNVELHCALGRSDLEVDAGTRHWVFEIKFAAKDSEESPLLSAGIRQMRERRYGESFSGDRPGRLCRAVLVFSGRKRRFVDWTMVEPTLS